MNFGRARELRRSKNKVLVIQSFLSQKFKYGCFFNQKNKQNSSVKLNLKKFEFLLISISLFIYVLKMTIKFEKRDIEFDIVPVNEFKF